MACIQSASSHGSESSDESTVDQAYDVTYDDPSSETDDRWSNAKPKANAPKNIASSLVGVNSC